MKDYQPAIAADLSRVNKEFADLRAARQLLAHGGETHAVTLLAHELRVSDEVNVPV